jgi:two-component system, OmpR family, sensor histidine kinase KdpD
MQRIKNHRFWRSSIRAIPGTVLVGLVSFICYGLGVNLTVTGFLYLIVVVLQSLGGDFGSSVIVSIIADVCLNFFFIPPIFSLRVSDASDIWALITFFITGLVITRLTTQVRQEAETSESQRHQMRLLYELAQRLLELDLREEVATKSAALFRAVFGLRAVCLYDGIKAELHIDGESHVGLGDRTRAAYIARQDSDDAAAGVSVRSLRVFGSNMGAIGFEGLRDAELTVGPLTTLAATLLERARISRDASHADAAAQAEVFRGVVLDALAHEFKTPLATIVAAAGGLRATSGLRPEQMELAETAEMEASHLGLLTSRLLRIARLDREEVQPHLELIDIAELVTNLVDQYAERWPDRQFRLTKDVPSAEVLADAELLGLAVRQLLDNARRYSESGSAITIGVEVQRELVTIRVWNLGNPVPSNERSKIFERFYRGTDAQGLAPGSGLGLYVARKIAKAHGGNLDLQDDDERNRPGSTFRLTIPAAMRDSDQFATTSES